MKPTFASRRRSLRTRSRVVHLLIALLLVSPLDGLAAPASAAAAARPEAASGATVRPDAPPAELAPPAGPGLLSRVADAMAGVFGPAESETLIPVAQSDDKVEAPAAPVITATKADAFPGPTADPGEDITYTVTINNSGTVGATGLTFADTVGTGTTFVANSAHASPVAFDDAYTWVGNTVLDSSARGLAAVTANDVIPNPLPALPTPDTFVVTPLSNAPTTKGGTVTLLANGHFTYTPPANYTGTGANADSFTYTLSNSSDSTLTGTGKVTIDLPTKVVYVQNATTNGTGTSASPRNSPASASTDATGTDMIYVFSDIGANPKLNGPFTLDGGQQLLGQGVALVVNVAGLGNVTLFPAGAAPTITNTAAGGNAVTLNSTGGGNTVRGLTIGTTAGVALTGSGFGALTVDTTVTINNSNATGRAIALTNGSFAAGAAFASVTSIGGTNGVSLSSMAGSVNLGTGALSGASGATFNVSGGSVSATYSGNVTQGNNAAVLAVSGGHTGTLTFQTGTVSATAGTGLQFDNADGAYNFNGTTTLNGGDAGVDILNGSGGSFTFASGTTITGPSGTAFNVVGGTAGVTYSGNITKNNAGSLVSVTAGHATGTITFQTGTLSATTASAGNGLQFDNADGTYNFNGTTTLNGGDAGIDIVNGSGGSFTFSSNTTITSPSGFAYREDSSSPGVTYNGTITQNSAAAAVVVVSKTGGTTTTFNGTITANTSTATAVTLANNGSSGGGTINFTNTLTLSTSSGNAFNVTAGGTVSASKLSGALASVGVSNGGTGFTSVPGVTITGGGGSGAVGTASLGVGTIAVTNAGSGYLYPPAVTITGGGGSGAVAFARVDTTGVLKAVTITNPGSGYTSAPTISIDNTGTGGSGAAASATLQVVRVTLTNAGGSYTTAPTVGFTGGGGSGATATAALAGASTLSSITGAALRVTNTNVGAAGLIFRSISSNGGTSNGIVLDATGPNAALTVTGTGTTGSGGTVQGKLGSDGSVGQGIGVYLAGTRGVSLAFMAIEGCQNYGIRGVSVVGFTLDNSLVGTVLKNGTSVTADTTSPSAVSGEGSVRFENLTGTATISNSTLDNGFGRTIFIYNNAGGTTLDLTFSNSTLRESLNNSNGGDTTGGTTDALFVQAGATTDGGASSATVNLTLTRYCQITAYRQFGILTDARDSATMTINVDHCAFSNSNAGNVGASTSLNFSGGGGSAIDVFVKYDVHDNSFRHGPAGLGPAPANGGAHIVSGQVSGKAKFDGKFVNNVLGVPGVAGSGAGNAADAMRLFATGNQGTTRVNGTTHTRYLVQGNTVYRYGEVGMQINARQGNAIIDATVIGNIVREPGTAALGAFGAIWVNSGATGGDTNGVNIAIGSATVAADKNRMQDTDPNNFDDVFLDKGTCAGCGSTLNLYRNGSTAAGSGEALLRQILVDDNLPTLDLMNGFTNGSPTVASGLPPQPSKAAEFGARGESVVRVAEGPREGEEVEPLSESDLDYVVRAAVARLEAGQISDRGREQIEAIRAVAEDLPDGQLVATDGRTVKVDPTAAGYGWFVDGSPFEDGEFVAGKGRTMRAPEESPAAGRMDLLSAVMRALATTVRMADGKLDASTGEMPSFTLAPGVRRFPKVVGEAAPIDSARPEAPPEEALPQEARPEASVDRTWRAFGGFQPVSYREPAAPRAPRTSEAAPQRQRPRASSDSSSHKVGAVDVSVSVGTLPAGKTVVVKFRATISSTIKTGTVSNQGTVSGSNFSSVSTTDPGPPVVNGPTVTTISIPTVQFSQASYQVNEDGTASGPAVTITRTGNTSIASSVDVQFTAGTATGGGTDFTSTTQTINFAVGDASKTVTVPINNDNIGEPNESLTMTLASQSVGVIGAQSSATLTILASDTPTVTLSLTPTSSINESAPGNSTNVRATLSNPASATVTVTLAVNGTSTASAGDYSLTGSPITIAASSTTGDATLTATGDTSDEPDETVKIDVASVSANATIAGGAQQVTATILDDDVAPAVTTVQFSQSTYQVSEDGSAVGAQVSISRTGDTTVASSVQVQFADGSATGGGTDYTSTTQTINFAIGDTSKTVTVPINDDMLAESDETLTMTLASPSVGVIGAQNSATLTIVDNDTACAGPPSISQGPTDATVCLAATATFSVTASGAGTLTYQWRKGTAPLSDGAKYQGTATSTLMVLDVGAADTGTDYNVVVTGCGNPATSGNAALALDPNGCFDSQFAAGSDPTRDWSNDVASRGAWSLDGTGNYATAAASSSGLSSISHSGTYGSFDYRVDWVRTGTCATCPTSLYIRGVPQPVQPPYQRWFSCYQFSVTADGRYSVWLYNGTGAAVAVQAWTPLVGVAINAAPAANWMQVTIDPAQPTMMHFVVNGVEVAMVPTSGVLTSGQVGVSMMRNTTVPGGLAEVLKVDRARLGPHGALPTKAGEASAGPATSQDDEAWSGYKRLSKKQRRVNREAQRAYELHPELGGSPEEPPALVSAP